MPEHSRPPLTVAPHPAPAPSAAVPQNGAAATHHAHPALHTPPRFGGPGEEVTAVLPRRPHPVAGPPPVPPVPPQSPPWGFTPGRPGPSPSPMAPPRRARPSKGTWIAAALAAVVVTVCAGLVINFASGTDGPSDPRNGATPAANTTAAQPSPSAAPAATMPLSALPGVRLEVATINSIEGATNIAPRPDAGNDTMGFVGGDNDRPDCGEIHGVALQKDLDNSGYLAVRTQALQDPQQTDHVIDDGAIYFSTAKAANDFVAKQAQAWPKCNGATLHPTPAPGEPPSIWMVGTVANHDGMLTVINTEEGAEGWQCQRALTARNNVVIDVRDCGMNPQAITIATRMADRVTAH